MISLLILIGLGATTLGVGWYTYKGYNIVYKNEEKAQQWVTPEWWYKWRTEEIGKAIKKARLRDQEIDKINLEYEKKEEELEKLVAKTIEGLKRIREKVRSKIEDTEKLKKVDEILDKAREKVTRPEWWDKDKVEVRFLFNEVIEDVTNKVMEVLEEVNNNNLQNETEFYEVIDEGIEELSDWEETSEAESSEDLESSEEGYEPVEELDQEQILETYRYLTQWGYPVSDQVNNNLLNNTNLNDQVNNNLLNNTNLNDQVNNNLLNNTNLNDQVNNNLLNNTNLNDQVIPQVSDQVIQQLMIQGQEPVWLSYVEMGLIVLN